MTDVKEAAAQRVAEIMGEKLAEYHREIESRLSIDCREDPDPLIDLPDVATLAGVQPGTPGQWRQRTKRGQAAHAFPEPAPGIGERFEDKPLWYAVSQIIPYLERTGNWPPGAGARPKTRGRRINREPESEAA